MRVYDLSDSFERKRTGDHDARCEREGKYICGICTGKWKAKKARSRPVALYSSGVAEDGICVPDHGC